jgi:hypothetical protein
VNFKAISGAALLLMNALSANFALSQMNNYAQTNLVSNVPGLALTVDDDLLHPWGMAVSANQPFRVAENGKGKFKSYDASGAQRDPRGIIAVPSGVTSPASPTGVAANTTSLFVPSGSPLPSPFLFAKPQQSSYSTAVHKEPNTRALRSWRLIAALRSWRLQTFITSTLRRSPRSLIRWGFRERSSIPICRLVTLLGISS